MIDTTKLTPVNPQIQHNNLAHLDRQHVLQHDAQQLAVEQLDTVRAHQVAQRDQLGQVGIAL